MAIPKELDVKMVPKDSTRTVVPSVVYPGEFQVSAPLPGTMGAVAVESRTGKKLDNPVFGVPLDESQESLAIRSHEYAHLAVERKAPALTKLLTKKLPDAWMQAGLDNIVNGFSRARRVYDVDHLPLPKISGDRTQQAQSYLQCLSAKMELDEDGTRHAAPMLDDSDKRILEDGARRLQTIGSRLTYSDDPKANGKLALSILQNLVDIFTSTTDTSVEKEKNYIPDAPVPMDEEAIPGLGEMKTLLERILRCKTTTYPGWCDLYLEKVALDKRVPRKLISPRHAAGMYGAFRNPLRALIPAFDGLAFDRKKKLAGGTLLLDMSGSMNVTEHDILRMLEIAPHATVAGYSSKSDNTCPLWILADKGKYASKIPDPFGWNGADGPALRWLAKQRRPLIWICDGFVTGKEDKEHPRLTIECFNLCKRYGIARLPNLATYFEVCAKKPK